MKRLVLVMMVLVLLAGFDVMPARARERNTYIVRPGDTLIRTGAHHGEA